MSVLTLQESGGYVSFDEDQCKEAGQSLATRYREASPFPHIAIDDFVDAAVLRRLLAEFPGSDGRDYFDREQERLKFQYHPGSVQGALVKNLLAELNSEAFLTFLEEMTGIGGLIPDPYYLGGGLHETKRGGHLGVHADFNIHNRMKLVRRLNLLIYLNDDWSPEYGGELELWDRAMTKCEVKVSPLMARAVVFNTDLDSFHGHPDPLTCPPERSRRSIATYYYTATEEGIANLPNRTTVFRKRPGTTEKRDMKVAMRHFMADWTPPALRRAFGKKA
ncbi:Rps23 Pro-64 3,4-dihydroxylase Tpa1-like proline 4-hydroxylase [Sphingomonas zeicaulis]|uniref:2OG-Fe(II) oxygenase n=1 Tax=Sphingomonas zeicaulis TaxID=1632740 RepID=UPI003D231E34